MRKPDLKVIVKIPYLSAKDGKEKYKYREVGVAWNNGKTLSLEIYTMPGVRLMVVPFDPEEMEET